ncbi:M20 family metallopeptidase [Cohnella soli]|uniref:M20 family metallopeptidase n=1 Tax=Cohnella soli TaxID=425005 RepID=A0ABW0HNI7_9BACL
MRIREWIDANRDGIVGLAADLIRFDTVNRVTDGTEKASQQYLATVLEEGLGLEVDLFSPEEAEGFRDHPAYYPGKEYSERPNVVARWPGTGGGRSLLFSSHIDTAPVAPGWERDPWTPVVEGDRLYGLGAFDMKGGLAASVMAVRCLRELGYRPQGDVLIESVVDEEYGGANGTVACRARGYEADAAIVPEPTNLAVCPATRGGAMWRATFRGSVGMSFSGETIRNPAYEAGAFLCYLETFEKRRAEARGPEPWYGHDRSLPVIVTRVEAGDMRAELNDSGPAECHIDVWVECYPGTTEEALRAELLEGFRAYLEERGLGHRGLPDIRKLIRFLPGAEVAHDMPLIRLLAEETAKVAGRPALVQGAPFACDAFVFNIYGRTPAIVFGPPGGNAHAPDEYVDIPGLCQLVEIYARAIVEWCGTE